MRGMCKRTLKFGLARAGGAAGLWALLERTHRRTWTIVCYHRVLPAAGYRDP